MDKLPENTYRFSHKIAPRRGLLFVFSAICFSKFPEQFIQVSAVVVQLSERVFPLPHTVAIELNTIFWLFIHLPFSIPQALREFKVSALAELYMMK